MRLIRLFLTNRYLLRLYFISIIFFIQFFIYAVPVDHIIVVVNEEAITKLMIDLGKKEAGLSATEKIDDQQVFDRLFEDALLNSQTRILNTPITNAEIDNQIESIKSSQNLTDSTFIKFLNESGYTLSDFKINISQQIKRKKLVDQFVRTKVVVNDSKLKEFYSSQPKSDINYSAVSYLVKLSANPDQKEVADSKKEIDKLYNDLKSGKMKKADFDKYFQSHPNLARQEFSLNGNELIKEFKSQLDKLKNGELSKPFQTVYGFHILELENKNKVIAADNEITDQNRKKIEEDYFQAEFQKQYFIYINQLLKDSTVKILDSNYARFLQHYNFQSSN